MRVMKSLRLLNILIIFNCVHRSLQDEQDSDPIQDFDPSFDYQARSIGGSGVMSAEFSFVVSIWMVEAAGKAKLVCGGALIKPDLVLTSMQCLVYLGVSSVEELPLERIVIVFNRNNRASVEDTMNKQLSTSPIAVWAHPKWSNKVPHSLMVLKLRQKYMNVIKGTDAEDKVGTIGILAKESSHDLTGILKVAGFDEPESDDDGMRFLKRLSYEILPPMRCNQYFSGEYTPTEAICGSKTTEDVSFLCDTDDGGPVLINHNKMGWKLIGIISNSHDCTSERSWELFTLVDYHWINAIIRNKKKPNKVLKHGGGHDDMDKGSTTTSTESNGQNWSKVPTSPDMKEPSGPPRPNVSEEPVWPPHPLDRDPKWPYRPDGANNKDPKWPPRPEMKEPWPNRPELSTWKPLWSPVPVNPTTGKDKMTRAPPKSAIPDYYVAV